MFVLIPHYTLFPLLQLNKEDAFQRSHSSQPAYLASQFEASSRSTPHITKSTSLPESPSSPSQHAASFSNRMSGFNRNPVMYKPVSPIPEAVLERMAGQWSNRSSPVSVSDERDPSPMLRSGSPRILSAESELDLTQMSNVLYAPNSNRKSIGVQRLRVYSDSSGHVDSSSKSPPTRPFRHR